MNGGQKSALEISNNIDAHVRDAVLGTKELHLEPEVGQKMLVLKINTLLKVGPYYQRSTQKKRTGLD